jgi:hypothetical protein
VPNAVDLERVSRKYKKVHLGPGSHSLGSPDLVKRKAEAYQVPKDEKIFNAHSIKEKSYIPAPSKYFKEQSHVNLIEKYLSKNPT